MLTPALVESIVISVGHRALDEWLELPLGMWRSWPWPEPRAWIAIPQPVPATDTSADGPGVYWITGPKAVYVGQSSFVASRDTYLFARRLGLPIDVILMPESNANQRIEQERLVAQQLTNEGFTVASDHRFR